jgi:vesicle coat complex subunit
MDRLLECLHAEDAGMRASAASTIPILCTSSELVLHVEAIDQLTKLLQDPDVGVLEQALRAVSNIAGVSTSWARWIGPLMPWLQVLAADGEVATGAPSKAQQLAQETLDRLREAQETSCGGDDDE